MQDATADNVQPPVTQGGPYTPAELALIEQLAHRRARRAEIEQLFPNRTLAAVKQQIVAARKRLGLNRSEPRGRYIRRKEAITMLDPTEPGEDDGWERAHRRAMTHAGNLFLEALAAA